MDLKDPGAPGGEGGNRTTGLGLTVRDDPVLAPLLAILAAYPRVLAASQEVSDYFFPSWSRSASWRRSRSSQESLTNFAKRPHFLIRRSAFSGV